MIFNGETMRRERKKNVGRPRIIASPAEFERLAAAYFDECAERDERPRITALALGVGLSGREALLEYEKRPEFSDAVKRAKSRVEDGYEKLLQEGGGAGAIFALKNFGWSDRQEMDLTHNGPPKVELVLNAPGTAPETK